MFAWFLCPEKCPAVLKFSCPDKIFLLWPGLTKLIYKDYFTDTLNIHIYVLMCGCLIVDRRAAILGRDGAAYLRSGKLETGAH